MCLSLEKYDNRIIRTARKYPLLYTMGTGPQGDFSLYGYQRGLKAPLIRRAPVSGIIVSQIIAPADHSFGYPPESCSLCPSCNICPGCPQCEIT